MHDRWQHDNLLERLFAYTPRVGREPLEDFCTEVLAWCLRNHEVFRKSFLERIGHPAGRTTPVIQTQVRFKPGGELEADDAGEEGEEEIAASIGGRFDLLIESTGDHRAVTVVECKRTALVSVSQIEKYRQHLDSEKDRHDVPVKRLVSLSNSREPEGVDRHVRWSDVYRLLKEATESKDERERNRVAATVCRKFAHFLESRNLNGLKIMKIDTTNLSHWIHGMRFYSQAKAILLDLRNDPDFKARFRTARRVHFEENKYGSWLGMYDNGSNGFYAGFWLTASQSGSGKAALYVERFFPGDWRNRETIVKEKVSEQNCEITPDYVTEDDRTFFHFKREIDGDLGEDAERMKEWFVNMTKLTDSLDQVVS